MTLVIMPALLLAAGAGAVSLRDLQYLEDSNTHALLHAPPPRDPESERRWRLNSCSPDEDLTGPGRLLAAAVGDRIQNAGTRVDHVVSSPMCNAVAAAGLLELVPVDVEGFLAPLPAEDGARGDRIDETIFYLANLRASETALLVTHGENIADLTGIETVPGQLLIIDVGPLGKIEVRFSIEP